MTGVLSRGIWTVRGFGRCKLRRLFRVEVIRSALAKVRERKLLVTDDTAACELIGQAVQLVCLPGTESESHPARRCGLGGDVADGLAARIPGA